MLTVLVLVVQLRMSWPAGTQLVLALAALAVVGLLLAGLAPEDRPYVSSLVACALAFAGLAIARLVDVLTDVPSAGTATWAIGLVGLVALALRRFRAATATLVLGLVAVAWPVAVACWLADPSDGVVRLLLLLSSLGLALGAIVLRDHRPTHAAQLAGAGGVAVALIVGLPQLGVLVVAGVPGLSPTGWGWELVALVVGFGLVAYGAIDRQRGAVLVGVVDLVLFALSASSGDSLLGWPLVLGLAAGSMLAVGLRPTTPAPEPPDAGADVPEPLPLPRLR